MDNFPTLSTLPNIQGFIKEATIDPTIRSKFENGYELTRSRFTNISYKWTSIYSFLTAADKILLEDFQDDVNFGANSFKWTNPADDIIYEVRFGGPLKFTHTQAIDYYSTTLLLIETRPNSNENIS